MVIGGEGLLRKSVYSGFYLIFWEKDYNFRFVLFIISLGKGKGEYLGSS